jgi:argininosuccinate lyase
MADDIYPFLTPEQMINRRTSQGGTATENVVAAIQSARRALKAETGDGL